MTNLAQDPIDAAGERLREERLRLGKNQADFGAAGGVGKSAQINYESGDRRPDTLYLQGIAGIGADCQYILTGVRSLNMRDVQIAAEDDFLIPHPPKVRLAKDIDAGLLSSLLSEVLRVAESYSDLKDVTHADIAAAVVQAYLERTGGDQGKLEAALIAALNKEAG